MRGLQLDVYGTDEEHSTKAYRDFTVVINSGVELAGAFARRARIHFKGYDNNAAALTDIDAAIDIVSDMPRAYYFEQRAIIYFALAIERGDSNYIHTALIDIDRALEYEPENEEFLLLKAQLKNSLKFLPEDKG